MALKTNRSAKPTQKKAGERTFTFDEYKKIYFVEGGPKKPADDDPDAVAGALATETVAILRKGLEESG